MTDQLRDDLLLYWLLIGLLFAFAADALWNLGRGGWGKSHD